MLTSANQKNAILWRILEAEANQEIRECSYDFANKR